MLHRTHANIHFNIFYYSLLAGLLLFPFTVYPMFPVSIIMFINWIAEGKWKEKWNCIKSKPFFYFFIAFITFFIVCFIGAFYQFNLTRAAVELGAKAWFFFAPLLILTANKELLTKRKIDTLFLTFFISCGIMMILNYLISFVQYLQTSDINYFFYKSLSHFVSHPTFCALYICFCLILNFYFLFFSKRLFQPHQKKLLYGCFILWMASIIMLQSKAGILAFTICGILLGSYSLLLINKPKWYIAPYIILFVGIMYVGSSLTPNNRLEILLSGNWGDGNDPRESSSMRLKIWEVSTEVALEHLPFGVGTGNAKEYLVPKYQEYGYTYLVERRSNPHNQYLQTTIDTGIPGLLSLLALCIVPLFYAFKKKDIIYMAFLGVVLFNMLFDSILERRMGCDIIAVFNCLLCFKLIFLSPPQDVSLKTEKN